MQMTNRAWSELALLSLIWGASFFSVAISLREMGPLQAVWFRVAIGALGLWGALAVLRLAPPMTWRFWGAALVMGILNNVIPFTLMSWGQLRIESGLTSILNAATALFGVLVAAVFLRAEPLTRRRVAGVILGLSGVALIVGWRAVLEVDLRSLAQIAVLAGTVSYAFASVWARITLSDAPPVAAATAMVTCSAVVMTGLAWWLEGPPPLALSGSGWLSVIYIGLFATTGAYLLYYSILRQAGAGNLMLCTLMIPPIAVALGAVWLEERLTDEVFAGFALIALGLLVLDGRVLAAFRRQAG